MTEPEESGPAIPLPAVPHPTVPGAVIAGHAEPAEPPAPTVPNPAMTSQAGRASSPRAPVPRDEGPLLGDVRDLRASWQRAKAGFVDDPRGSATDAGAAVDELAERLLAGIRDRCRQIRETWDGDQASPDTEAMRVAVLRYQALFRRLAGDEPGES